MDLNISVPCKCIIDDEPNVLRQGTPEKLELIIENNEYRITQGNEDEITFDNITIASITITVKDVELILDRNACDGKLKISVCKGSYVWMKNFFDIFPEMILRSEGHIRQLNYDGRYMVGKLTIGMNPDYSNDSSIIGFQVVNKLNIKYHYNGLIQGYFEEGCVISKPDVVCMGKCSRILVRPITPSEQRKINKSRSSDSYKILVNITDPNKELVSICMKCADILPCFKSNCQHILCNDCIVRAHTSQGSRLIPPYFKCPINHCQKKVNELSYLDKDDVDSQTDEES